MNRLFVLGTGNAMATRCYNTCFALKSGDEYILVDAGGGNGILARLQAADIAIGSIRHLVLTHEHSDHLLGAVWIVRAVTAAILAGKYKGNLSVWCHEGLEKALRDICGHTLQPKFTRLIGERINFSIISDGHSAKLGTQQFTFFDIHSTKALQYGFSAELEGGVRLTCLGDEPYNPACEKYVRGSDWLLSEAFCLYKEREKYKPYEKHHSTVKEACELAEELNIPNLVLWHTEDDNYTDRKELYTAEGRKFYSGNLLVPRDGETLALINDK